MAPEEEITGEEEFEEIPDRPEDVAPDATPSFDINQNYQSNYLKSNYESDDYHELKTMEEDLDHVVRDTILKSDSFVTLRPLTHKDISEGMDVKVFNEKKAKIVSVVGKDKYTLKLNDGTILPVTISNIERDVDPVMKLKKPQLIELYEKCYAALSLKTSGRLDIVNFFYIFTEYFRVNEKYLFSCLEPKSQAILLEEIKKRTGWKFKEGIKTMFNSGR